MHAILAACGIVVVVVVLCHMVANYLPDRSQGNDEHDEPVDDE